MRKTLLAVGAIALFATVGIANAAEVVGRTRTIDDADHRVVLTNGQAYTFEAIPGEPYFSGFDDGFTPGQKVRITHEGGTATGITLLR